ncbi:MAG: tetratricopeptide repeat protein [Arenicella sp.]|nr:tetratricopeptide repeat protein [Arenicella sp.]
MPTRFLFVALLISATAIFLSACSQDDADQLNTESAVAPLSSSATLREIPHPNPATMEADVAALLEASWSELNSKLADADSTPASKAEAYANYGLTAYGNGVVIPAEAAIENAKRLAPNDVRWIYFLALMHQAAGNLDQAATGFERVLELRNDDLPALIRLGNVRFEQAHMDKARELYRQVLVVDAQSAAALFGLGRVASATGNYKEAVSLLEKVLELQPSADRSNYLLGLAWRNLGDRDKAAAYLARRGTGEPGFADPLFDQISGGAARIGGLWANMNAGSQALVDGNYALAVEEFRRATQNHPDDPRSWQSLGMGLAKTGDTEGAENAYLRALELADDNAVVHHKLAALLIETARYADAEKHLMQAIEIDERMLEAHAALASLLTRIGRTEEALKRFDTALSLDPQSGELAISRAETLIALGRSDDAVTALAAAARINPLDASVGLAYGVVLAEVGQLDKATKQIRRVLDATKDDNTRGRAHYALGHVHLQRGNGNEAIASFGNALKLDPRNRAAGLELARTFVRVRDLEQALATYDVHIGLWQDDDVTRLEAARVALMLGNGSKALSLLQDRAEQATASARLIGSLARLLVLAGDANIRNPKLALQLAQRAVQKSKALQHRETLALCRAALGQFNEAVQLQERLLQEAPADIAPANRSRLQENLDRYRTQSQGRLPFDAS